MNISTSFNVGARCDTCGASERVDVWSVVSETDRPDLVDAFRRGLYHFFTCRPHGHPNSADLPVLIHRPSQGGLALLVFGMPFIRRPGMEEMIPGLTDILFSNLGISGGEAGILPVPRVALAALLERDVRADMDTPPDQLILPTEFAADYVAMLARLRGERP